MVKSYKIIVQYQNQDVDIDTMHWSCTHEVLNNFITRVGSRKHHLNQDRELSLSQGSFKLSFNNDHTQLPPALPPSIPGNYKSILRFQNVSFLKSDINKIIQM